MKGISLILIGVLSIGTWFVISVCKFSSPSHSVISIAKTYFKSLLEFLFIRFSFPLRIYICLFLYYYFHGFREGEEVILRVDLAMFNHKYFL